MNAAKQKVAAVIAAAGAGRRMGGVGKVFALLGGRPILARVVDTFQIFPGDGELVDTGPGRDQQLAKPEIGALLGLDRSPLDIDPAHASCQVDRDLALPVKRFRMDENIRGLRTRYEKVL